ncbi:hypothetical protein [Paenibacillus sp. YYML68]|uniref:hypothetical protein n=1 Tax=Paenibacillus sp. YYML68 TaxID=2909250 RepID=UPI00248F7682|nr:hypothetical protein [Paenibacillus sp. YYML68]
MKKMIIMLLVVSTMLISCSIREIPIPTVKVENPEITIPVEIISYSWLAKDEYGGAWDDMQDKEAVVVPKKSKINISFEYKPKNIQIRHHISKTEWENFEKNVYEINVPDKEGIHIYSMLTNWSEGIVDYALKIEVK